MPSTPIHPTNELDMFDGGPAVDRKNSNSSGSIMNSGKDHNHNNMDKQYYSEHDFDDMIAGVIEPTKRSSGGRHDHRQQQQQEEYNEYEQDQFSSDDDHNNDDEYQQQHQGPMVDILPNARGSTSEDEDDNDGDAVSLNSDDISGGSDISDVERQQNTKGGSSNSKNKKRDNFQPRPLINDDESTVDMRPPAPVNQSVSSYVEALNQAQTRKNRIVKLGMLLTFVGIIVGIVLGVVSATSGNNNEGKELNSELEYNGGENNNSSISGLGSNQISVKEGYMGNGTTYSPTISPVYYFNNEDGTPSPIASNSLANSEDSALPTVRPTLSTNAPTTVRPTPVPFAMTEPPVTVVRVCMYCQVFVLC
jgi:hypothetical protein